MFLKAKNLEKFPEVIHGFTTRELGSDYERIGREIGVPGKRFLTLKQVHSDGVVLIPNDKPEEGDALITQQPGFIVGVRTADCVPLLAYDSQHKAVASIHAGWKGVLAGIIEASIREMKKEFNTDPSDLVIAVGATLCENCFEMGPSVAAEFRKKFGPRLSISQGKNDRSHLDLKGACEIILNDAGVSSRNMEYLPYCNKCRSDLFFSFRRGDEEPRQLSFIGLAR